MPFYMMRDLTNFGALLESEKRASRQARSKGDNYSFFFSQE